MTIAHEMPSRRRASGLAAASPRVAARIERVLARGAGSIDRSSFNYRLWVFGRAVFPPFTWAVITITALMFFYDWVFQPTIYRAPLTDPTAVSIRRLTDRSVVYPIEGTDASGRSASFNVVVFDKSYTWVRGSTDQLADNTVTLSRSDLRDSVLGGAVRDVLASSRAVIAVGVASQEGELETEQERARQRALQSARWLTELVGIKTPIWTLNLGKYLPPDQRFDDTATSWQRPFILIGVSAADPDVLLDQALADAMRNKSNLPSAESYVSFAFERFN